MSFFESGSRDDKDFDAEKNSVEEEIKRFKEIITAGRIYECIESLEEMLLTCYDNEFYEDGLYFADQLLEVSPYNSEYWLRKGNFLNGIFKFDEAIKCYNKALSLNPGDSEILVDRAIAEENLGLNSNAKETLQAALVSDPNNDEAVFSLGLLYQKAEEFEEALKCFSRVTEIDNEYAEAYYELGFCYENLCRLSDALKAYEKFLSLEPYNANGWYNRGIVLGKLNMLEKAIDSYDLALAIREDFSSAWFNKGNALADLGRLQQAIECFANSYKLDPTDEASCYNIANI
jgi:tetratricopeptide (TPR) repeat protein